MRLLARIIHASSKQLKMPTDSVLVSLMVNELTLWLTSSMPTKFYSPEEAAAIKDRAMAMGTHHNFTEYVARPLAQTFWRVSGTHPDIIIPDADKERIPEEAFVAPVNHSHNHDSVAVKVLFKGREVMVPAALYLFENVAVARLYRTMGAVPLIRPDVDAPRSEANWEEVRDDHMVPHLQNGGIAFVYDEGTRDPSLHKGKGGAADLAVTASVPMLPIGLAGSHIEGSPIAFSVGELIEWDPNYDDARNPHRTAVVDMTRKRNEQMPELFTQAYQLVADATGEKLRDILPPITYSLDS